MPWTLQIQRCNSTEVEIINAYRCEISCDYDNQIEELNFWVNYNIEGEETGEVGFVGGEWNPAVLLKNGDEVSLFLGTELWFFGYIYKAPKEITAFNRDIQYTANDPKFRLIKSQVPYQGLVSWGLESPKLKFTEVFLDIATGYNVGESRTYFIPYTQGVFFDQATYLGTSDNLVLDGGATLTLSANDLGFTPRGFVIVDRTGAVEIVYYDGYFFNGVNWQLTNCVRTQLGTVGGPHAPGVVVQQLTYKEITQDAEMLELQEPATDYIRIPYSRFTKNRLLGGFTFNQAQNGNVRGTYQIYDETATDVLLMEDIFTIFCTADRDNGGAGFTAGELDFAALNIAINLYQYDLRFYNGYALDLLNRLVDQLQLNILFYWSSSEGTLKLRFLTQETTPDITLTQVKRAHREEDFDELFTSVRVIYQDEDNFSSLDPDYGWHVAPYSIRDTDFRYRLNNAYRPDLWMDEGNTYGDDPRLPPGDKHTENKHGITDDDRFAAIQNTWGFRNVMDNKGTSTLTAWWNKNYVDYYEIFDALGEWHHSYYWFTADAEIRSLEEIRLQIGDNRRGEAIVTVYGATNFNPATMDPDDAAIEWFEVSPEMTRVGGISGDSEASFTFDTTKFTQPSVNILRVTFHSIPRDASGEGNPSAIVQEFFVRAGKTKTLLVSLTNDIAEINNPEFVYDVDAYNRLACVRPIVDKLEIGKASDQEALFLGRERLIEALTYFFNRDYTYDKLWTDRKPRIGDTIQTEDLQKLTFTGVLIEYLISFERGDPNLQFDYTTFNFDAEVIGG